MLKRQTLRDYSDYSLKQINDNFMGIFLKLSGNIDYMDMRDGAVVTDKIRDGAVTGDKILEGTLSIFHVNDEFVSNINLLENATFLSLSNTVDEHSGDIVNNTTAIQQNSKEIKLSAERIATNSYNISELSITADGITSNVTQLKNNLDSLDRRFVATTSEIKQTAESISSTVSKLSSSVDSLDKDVIFAFSSIEQNANRITSKVGYGDVISSINQSSERISINANRVDLSGVTTLYSYAGSNDYATFSGASFGLYVNGRNRLSVHPDVSMTRFSGNPIQFSDSVYFDSTVDFSRANVVGLDVTAIFG